MRVLLLLPPSEGKREGLDGKYRLQDLSFDSELAKARRETLKALGELCGGDRTLAAKVLGLPATLHGEVDRNARLKSAPVAPAGEIYSGVLFDALDWSGLSGSARARGARSIVIISALFGALRLIDPIPAYRLSMDVSLSGVGPLATHWRTPLSKALDPVSTGLVIDCRSATYVAAWPTPLHGYSVKVFVERAGKRSVVSHMAKESRGLLAHGLLTASRAPKTVDDVVRIGQAQFRVEVIEPSARKPGEIHLIR